MVKLKEIEDAISNLQQKELAEFRAWFEKFDAAVWDKQFDEDVTSGKLNKIAEKAIDDYKKGKCKEL